MPHTFVLQRGASPEAFFNYVVEQVLPKLGELTRTEDAGDVRLEILKLFAEMSPNELSEKAVTSSIGLVYNLLLVCMLAVPCCFYWLMMMTFGWCCVEQATAAPHVLLLDIQY